MNINFNANLKNHPSNKERNKGIITSLFASAIIGEAGNQINTRLLNPKIKKLASSVSEEEKILLKDAFKSAYKNNNLAKKGVKILFITKENLDKTADKLTDALLNTKLVKVLKKIIDKDAITIGIKGKYINILNSVMEGENAFYYSTINGIILSGKNKGAQLASFHEMGHALNHNCGKLSKVLQNVRTPIGKIAPTVILISALGLKNKKNEIDENGQKKTGLRQFIKNNAGSLIALTQLPAVLEEGIASLKGQKMAKQVLVNSPGLLKKIRLTNFTGFATYLMRTATLIALTEGAIKIKDDIQTKYEQKITTS